MAYAQGFLQGLQYNEDLESAERPALQSARSDPRSQPIQPPPAIHKEISPSPSKEVTQARLRGRPRTSTVLGTFKLSKSTPQGRNVPTPSSRIAKRNSLCRERVAREAKGEVRKRIQQMVVKKKRSIT